MDTSSTLTSVALHDGTDVIAVIQQDASARQGELLAPSIAEVLAGAGVSPTDLGRIAVGVGPGPFTGLRVGLMTARALGHALGVEVVGVMSLDAIAAQVPGVPLVVVTDARRKEVYWARYAADGSRESGPDVERPAAVAERLEAAGFSGQVVGPGVSLYPRELGGGGGADGVTASAAWVARLAAAGRTTDTTAPQYLRRPDVAAPVARKSVLS